ncbi:MAG: alpha-1,2-fucosyltransferase [Thermodesulfobacteriota bacterium]
MRYQKTVVGIVAPLTLFSYVSCQLDGQMGNQMFQIATTVAYALDHQCECSFPHLKEALNGQLNHQYVFHRLNIDPFPPDAPFHLYSQHEHALYNEYAPIPFDGRNLCLQGYFQNEKYFSHHSAVIRQLFAPAEKILTTIDSMYGDILKKPTVAVHVRTYFPEKISPDIGGIQEGNMSYYIEALAHFSDDFTFLVFSDCPEWTRTHFPRIRSRIEFIERNPHYIDFYLMSSCHHQIVSPRSSFSWWAAWLNPNPNKIVIAPSYGAYPMSWIRTNL